VSRLRRKVLPGGHFPVRHPGKPARSLLRRVFLRGRFTPIAIRLSITVRSGGRRALRVGDVYESYLGGCHDAG
jgi:hypothetical protein